MSKNFAVLRKATQPLAEPEPASREYGGLILRLFQSRAAVAVIGVGLDKGVVGVCEGIAIELAELGKRVVVVPVDGLLRMNPITVPGETALMSRIARNVWLWPSPLGKPIEFLNAAESKPTGAESWLDALRRNFDSVLLECPAVDSAFGVTEVAAMADAVVLVVEAGRSSKQQILHDQRALELQGAKLAGGIMLQRG
jgi:hypothetical protein